MVGDESFYVTAQIRILATHLVKNGKSRLFVANFDRLKQNGLDIGRSQGHGRSLNGVYYWSVRVKNQGSQHHAEPDGYVLITLRVMVPSIATGKLEFDAPLVVGGTQQYSMRESGPQWFMRSADS